MKELRDKGEEDTEKEIEELKTEEKSNQKRSYVE